MVPDQITVVVAAEGRHLFDAMQDPRVRVVDAHANVQPDLVVFPCSRHRRFENVAALTLPHPLREHIERGAGLVFDASLEGVLHKQDITAALHGVIQQLGGDPHRSVYVTQDRQYEADYQVYCRGAGIEPVSVLTYDYWVWFALDQYKDNGAHVFEQRLARFRARAPHRARKFVSLNRTPRPIKILFLLRLIHDGLWNDGFISFGGFRQGAEGPGKGRPTADELKRALPGFEDLVDGLAPSLDPLNAHGRILLGVEQFGSKKIDLGQVSTAVDLEEFGQSWFTAATDTEMRPRPSRITEKLIKPLVNFHPVLVLGNPGALRMLREYGFATFEEVFDESYDDVLDPRERFDRVYAQVLRVCHWSDDEWRRAEMRTADKLTFNARWGLTTFNTSFRRQYDVALVDRILDAVQVRNHC